VFDSVFPADGVKEGDALLTWKSWGQEFSMAGTLNQLNAAGALMKPSWSKSPFVAKFLHAETLRLARTPMPIEAVEDKLVIDKTELSGALDQSFDSGGTAQLAWKPAGAMEGSILKDNLSFQVIRSAFPGATTTKGRSRHYLTNGEILTGSLLSMSAEEVRFKSKVTGEIAIPHEQIRAFDLNDPGNLATAFLESDWETTMAFQGSELDFGDEADASSLDVEFDDGKVELSSGGILHPQLLLNDKITFTAKWDQSYGAITLHCFGSPTDPSQPTVDIVIAAQGSRVAIGESNRGRGFRATGKSSPMKDNFVQVEMIARADSLQIKLNGRDSFQKELKDVALSGNAMAISIGGAWRGWGSSENTVTLDLLSASRSPGYLCQRIIDSSARRSTLMLPRSMRDSAPEHLIFSDRGYTLRGTLKRLDEETLSLKVQDDQLLEIPRERIASIVWLRSAQADSSDVDSSQASLTQQVVAMDESGPFTSLVASADGTLPEGVIQIEGDYVGHGLFRITDPGTGKVDAGLLLTHQ
ncbi:MAG: hypothetical protein AAF226_15615, partial [Verrucomicrobiota bacterium]